MSVRIQEAPFDAGHEMEILHGKDVRVGALVSFTGFVRDFNEDAAVSRLTLEHYPGMTEKALSQLESEARRRWDIQEVSIIHRVGAMAPGDPIVLVCVTGAHRGEAFQACEFLMDALKTKAPFWKKEITPEGARWVDARQSDDEAAARWQDPRNDH